MQDGYDIVIIGAGAGGGTLAYALRDCGARILLVERGGFLEQEPQNWNAGDVFLRNRYKANETWLDAQGSPFKPGVHYFVGGNTKVYGAALPRFRREDFGALEHEGGTSPAWPVSYHALEPYYEKAERIYRVHGVRDQDPSDPPRRSDYPHGPIPHEPEIEDLSERLAGQGLHPAHLPLGIDLGPAGRCIRCSTCDGFPCKVLAKSDADVCCVRPALERPEVTLLTGAYAKRLVTDPTGRRVEAVDLLRDGTVTRVRGDRFVVSCGAVNSAALLLRSGSGPDGLGNSSGLVGRNYMVHNNTALIAVRPLRRNRVTFQKTLAVNDYYLGDHSWPYPMGNLQLVGKVQRAMLEAARPGRFGWALEALANRSIDWWVMSEDLPDPENRVTVGSDGGIRVHWKPNNLVAHERLVAAARKMMRSAAYPMVFAQPMGIETNSHQCGTARFGDDPASSVLDPFCRSHDVENLYVVDSSFFPSSAAMNPVLTIAAQALRVGDHIAGRDIAT